MTRFLLTSGLLVTICGGFCSQPCRAVEPAAVQANSTSAKATEPLSLGHILVAALDEDLPNRDRTLDRLLSRLGQESQKGGGTVEPQPVRVYLLLGGIVGPDGLVTSAGMFRVAKMLQALPDTTVKTYTWDKWRQAYKSILANEGKAKIVLIGYSGGGSRATWLANMPSRPRIDLMISYDPSPQWQMKPLGKNVIKALCYHNTNTMWLPGLGHLGGGRLVNKTRRGVDIPIQGPSIKTIDIAEHHIAVQIDQSLHRRTVEAVRSLASAAPERDAKSTSPTRQASAK